MSRTYTILVADDDLGQLELARDLLESVGYLVLAEKDATRVFDRVAGEKPDVVLLDVKMPHISGFDVCRQLKADPRTRAIPVMFVTACFKDVKDKVRGLELGADDYITKPYEIDEMLARVKAILRVLDLQEQLISEGVEKARLKEEVAELNQRLAEQRELPPLVAGSSRMHDVMKLIQAAGSIEAHVLILGETGTGKGLVAEMIHRRGPRSGGPFVKVDCSVLTGSLLESELFGHEKGSFTGAMKTREGRFERAAGGTIFLDEIGELPVELQSKLLRVVQDAEFERVGGDRTLRTDVRVIAATNVDLEKAVADGKFRRDLYYRLNVLPIRLPPLRQRPEDIGPMAALFLEKFAARNRRDIRSLDREALALLQSYSWPGNIRELEHVIERAVILSAHDTIAAEAILLDSIGAVSGPVVGAPVAPAGVDPLTSLGELEKQHIARVIEHTRGNKKHAAQILGISRNTLYEKLKAYGLPAGTES